MDIYYPGHLWHIKTGRPTWICFHSMWRVF